MTDGRHPSALRDHFVFLKRFLKNPRQVGALAPSSRALAREMLRHVSLTAESRVVELGPGTGVFTREIISRLPQGAKFLTVDIDPHFCDNLRARWPLLDCECGSAEHLPAIIAARAWPDVDSILSGLPFASLPTALSRAILSAIETTLRPGGEFTTFQYVHAYPTPAAAAFRREMTRRFGPMSDRRLVMGNVPPAFVLSWRQPVR